MKKKIYLIGIGGIAMANLACLLKKQGCLVSGSDIGTFGPSAALLKEHHIKYFSNHNPSNLKNFKPDLIIIGNAIKRGNPSLEYVLNEKLPYLSMPEGIKQLVIKDKTSIVVTGTSGKTTTTAMISWILKSAGLKPSALVGGIMKNTNTGFISENGNYAVIEGDEYGTSFYDNSPKFIHYNPYHALITNIQADHLDIYGNMDNIYKAFQKLTAIIPSSGSIVLNSSDNFTKIIKKETSSRVVTFGNNGDVQAKNIKLSRLGLSFDLLFQNKKLGQIESDLLGRHNIENMLAATAIALELKIPFAKISKALKEFKGVKRRLEIIYSHEDITIIDDFAHNPDKVKASLSALRDHFPKHKITAIFEPRTASSRRKFFQKEYISSFQKADLVYISEPYNKSALIEKEMFSNRDLAKNLNKKGIETYALKNADAIIKHLYRQNLYKQILPVIIVVMSSGDFDGIHRKLIYLLDRN